MSILLGGSLEYQNPAAPTENYTLIKIKLTLIYLFFGYSVVIFAISVWSSVGVGPDTDWLFKLNQTNHNKKLKNWSHSKEADSTRNNQEGLKGEHRL